MSDVTRIRSAIEQGDPRAAEQLLPLVYDELRKLAALRLAQEKPGQTLQATALVHEAYLRLVDVDKVQRWDSRGHFFAAAAEAMRRILVNRALEKRCLKRGGGWKRIDLDGLAVVEDASDEDLIAIDEAVGRLAEENQSTLELANGSRVVCLPGKEGASRPARQDQPAARPAPAGARTAARAAPLRTAAGRAALPGWGHQLPDVERGGPPSSWSCRRRCCRAGPSNERT
jgi:RNA polymerase sigma factor (TIGR02999 family)